MIAMWFLLVAVVVSAVALAVVVPRDGLGHRPPPASRVGEPGARP